MWVRKVIISCVLSFIGITVNASGIADFDISVQKGILIIHVYNEAGEKIPDFNGRQVWSLNGIDKELQFVGGKALFPMEKAINGLLYIKATTNQHLFYIQKEAAAVAVYSIPLWALWLIPIIILVIVSIIRKLIILAAFIVFISLLLMNGLDTSTLFSLFTDGFKALFS